MRQLIALTLLLLLILGRDEAPAAEAHKQDNVARPASITTNDVYRPFLINNIFNYYGNNGDGSYNKFSIDNEGFEFPKGTFSASPPYSNKTNRTVFFEDGIVWGGRHKGVDTPKVGGSTYRHGLQAGPIITPGTLTKDPIAADPSNPQYRIFRVRPDINPTVDFLAVQAMLDSEEVMLIGRYEPVTARDLYNQYLTDWSEWPASQGAPYTDINGDGHYDPAVDIPGVPGADQTLWYVANDLSRERLATLFGSMPPVGLEMQRTIWGYRRAGALGNTIFLSTVLVNKSGASIDSMFLAQWVDPDLGDAFDDHVGCDTTRGLGYVYNGKSTDAVYGTAVPAGGFLLLQGPLMPSVNDSAVFKLQYRKGFKNLPMSAFLFIIGGSPVFTDPSFDMVGAVMWYRIMRGTIAATGGPFIDPTTNQPTKFLLAGDPVGKTGSYELPNSFPSTDRRMIMVTGPFTMAPGDTQEIVMANLAGLGADYLSSITALRSASDEVHAVYKSLFAGIPPRVSSGTSFPSSTQALISISVDGWPSGATGASGSFRTAEGVSGPSFDLYDDGTHGDPRGGDKQFATVQSFPATLKPLSFDLSLIDRAGISHSWPGVVQNITVAGPLIAAGLLFSDNINSDGKVNPGENIRFGVSITNQTQFILQGLTILNAGSATVVSAVSSLAPGATDVMAYNESDPNSYFSVDVPSMFPDSLLKLSIIVKDSLGNQWEVPVAFPVFPLHDTVRTAAITQVSGLSGVGSFEIKVVKPADVRGHLYAIYGVSSIDSAGSSGFTLKDSTDGRVLLLNHSLPDTLGHTVPVTDGFKVLRGSITDQQGIRAWSYRGTRRWTYADGVGFGLESFWSSTDTATQNPAAGTIGNAYNAWFSGGVNPNRLRKVEIRLAAVDSPWSLTATPSDPNVSRGYRYLRGATAAVARPEFTPWIINKTAGFPYQDYNYSVPWSAWNMDVSPPQRLSVGHLENNVFAGRVDGRWWPALGVTVGGRANVDATGPREWWFIFDVPYSDAPDPQLTKDILNNTVPMMYLGTNTRRNGGALTPGDAFIIYPYRRPRDGDLWTCNPTILLSAPETGVPTHFALDQNYPNPFNPSTTIRYQLPVASRVRLSIYDLLGREVALLLDGTVGAGMHELQWSPRTVASGVYFYRLEATPQASREGRMIQTRKMLMLH